MSKTCNRYRKGHSVLSKLLEVQSTVDNIIYSTRRLTIYLAQSDRPTDQLTEHGPVTVIKMDSNFM